MQAKSTTKKMIHTKSWLLMKNATESFKLCIKYFRRWISYQRAEQMNYRVMEGTMGTQPVSGPTICENEASVRLLSRLQCCCKTFLNWNDSKF